MKTSGFGGVFDTPEKLASKLYSFRHKLMNVIDENELLKIYENKFLDKAKKICSKNENKLYSLDTQSIKSINVKLEEIFQFDVIVILPGQELPMHLNIPYFWGADRKSIPHWDLYDYKDNLMRSYEAEDFRISLVVCVYCFQDDQEFERYKNQADSGCLSIEEVSKVFQNDLKARNKLSQDTELKPFDLWTLIVNEYMKYPVIKTNN